MPVICTIDLETSGLDFEKDYITEIAYVIKEWPSRKPLAIRHSYIKCPVELSEFIVGLTGITDDLLEKVGDGPVQVLSKLNEDLDEFEVDYILAQNGVGFDRPMLVSKCKEYGILCRAGGMNWIDSREDIEWPETFKSTSLTFLACELGFLNPFPHDALSDCMTTNKVVEVAIEKGIVTLDGMIENSKIPWVYVQCNATYDTKEVAKKLRYRWERIDEVYCPKGWINKFKEHKLDQAKADAEAVGLRIRRIT